MADNEKEVMEKEEIPTRRQKDVDCKASDICLSTSPVFRSLAKFCDLYIGVEENFNLLELQDAMIKEQEKFAKVNDKIYEEAYGKPRPKMPEPPEDFDKMTPERKELIKSQTKEFVSKFTELSSKEVTLTYLAIEISKAKLTEVMKREEDKIKAGKDGILISPNDINNLRKFIDFV